ncbi:MAG: hypothetical protein KY475_14460 [Planctomycetes bacterium]|nr:hypothetical protein [Planctomycetota bacterium]
MPPKTANRSLQAVLIVSTLLGSWLGMQAVHELGHVLGAAITGGRVQRVVLHPLTISRTDVAPNPHPLIVVWAGPLLGVLAPLAMWGAAAALRMRGAFVLRFFAGFCLVANGVYIAGGSAAGVGDCGEMLRHGTPIWALWLFGAVAVPAGLWLWHRQGAHFGLGEAKGKVDAQVTAAMLIGCVLLFALGIFIGR